MEVKELRKLIRQSDNKSWFDSISIDVVYTHANFEITLSSLDIIYHFFESQTKFFENVEFLPGILNDTKLHFRQCINKLDNFINTHLKGNSSNLEGQWNQLKSHLSLQKNNNSYIFNKESETTDFLLKLDSSYQGASTGAYDFFTNHTFQYNIANKNYFIGWNRAYEFFTQDAELVKRRNNERQTLSKIRADYIKNLEQNDKNVDDHIAEKEKEYYLKEEAITRLIRKKNHQYEDWKSNSRKEFTTFLENSDIAIKDLEEIYKEKLKLEAPAKYWNDRAVKLKGEGQKWLIALVACSVIAILSLGAVLYFISDGTIKDLFSSSASAIRWSIVFITFVSFLAFAIRIFSKLTFSSYHLVRDAEEREQLAYVFLALKKEKNIDPTEQHLIMQSLFSRADSGLLKDDASPTMPGGSMIEKLMGGK
ncbi:MAG: hypothetical protein ACI9WV_001122 [Patiriisocius sp.]|jgi:hypothetical protein